MDERHISFNFKARYFTAGTLDASTRQVWIVLHGYGQLAKYFLKKFEPLTAQNIFIIAPEGLSRFYLSELTSTGRPDNKVGATWMTREDRQTDIDNYIHYLDTVYTHVLTGNTVPVTLFGFSQGCATVCRWAIDGHPAFHRLILWAGLFPPDMDFEKGHDILSTKENYMIIGDQDPFLTPERMEEFDQLAAKLNIQPTKYTFPGKHELNLELMQQFAK
jgi:predicted esterase